MKQEAPVIYVWFAENKGTERDGEQFIRAWTHDPARVDGLRNAIGKEPTIYAAIEQAARTAPVARNAGLMLPKGWEFSIDESDGRVWLHIKTPQGSSCIVSAPLSLDGGRSKAIAGQVLEYLGECLAAPEALPEIPEGCTPEDAQMLRLANHGLAQEIDRYRVALSDLCTQIHTFAEQNGEADFETGRAEKLLQSADGKSVSFLTDHERRPVGEAVAWLWNEKPCEFNDYQSRPRVTFARPKNTEAPGGMQALGVIATTAQPAKDSGDAQDAKRYRHLTSRVVMTDASTPGITVITFVDDAIDEPNRFLDEIVDAAIASAEREGK